MHKNPTKKIRLPTHKKPSQESKINTKNKTSEAKVKEVWGARSAKQTARAF
jgi:hypothetical protein